MLGITDSQVLLKKIGLKKWEKNQKAGIFSYIYIHTHNIWNCNRNNYSPLCSRLDYIYYKQAAKRSCDASGVNEQAFNIKHFRGAYMVFKVVLTFKLLTSTFSKLYSL